MKTLLIIAAALLLTACSQEISQVKDAPSNAANGYTTGQVMDNDPNCAKVKWSTFRDDNGRKLVEYSCTMKTDDAFMALVKQALDKRLDDLETKTEGDYRITRLELDKSVNSPSSLKRKKFLEESLQIKKADIAEILTSGKPIGADQRLRYEQVISEDQREIDQVSLLVDNERAASEPLLQQVIDFEDTFKTTLDSMMAEDRKRLDKYFSHGFKLEHKVFFLPSQSKATLVGYEFLINGEKLKIGGPAVAVVLAAIQSPNMRKIAPEWWRDRVVANLEFSMEHFPYTCYPNSGCKEIKPTR